MKKLHKRLTLDQQLYEQNMKLPILNHSQFSHKLNDMLDKVAVQNRYAHRISHCNMKNLQELQQARSELKRIAENKKMEELNAKDTNQLIQQMSVRVKDSQSELQKLFKELIDAKKEIKNLKSAISDLENDNLLLQKQVFQVKRQKFQQICEARKSLDEQLLTSQMGSFLVASNNTKSFLYQFCLKVHKENSYFTFFVDLDRKIEKELKNKQRTGVAQSLQKRFYSNIKLKMANPTESEQGYRLRRYKTEHNNTLTPINLTASRGKI